MIGISYFPVQTCLPPVAKKLPVMNLFPEQKKRETFERQSCAFISKRDGELVDGGHIEGV